MEINVVIPFEHPDGYAERLYAYEAFEYKKN
jgi:hypothetical protein